MTSSPCAYQTAEIDARLQTFEIEAAASALVLSFCAARQKLVLHLVMTMKERDYNRENLTLIPDISASRPRTLAF